MLEFAHNYEFDTIILIQATSPLLTSEDITGGFGLYEQKDTDSVLSVVRQNGFAAPTNYDVYHRPRRQEFEGYLVENGAFYITSKMNLLKSSNRVSGNIRAYEMDESTYFEIDEPSDWLIIENQLKNRKNKIGSEIKMFLADCDGCLTDGGMYYSEKGDELKKFNTKDGLGFRLLHEKGIVTGVITGENVELNRRRCEKLHLDIYEPGVTDKLAVIKQLCMKYEIGLENVAYIGDDIIDLEAIQNVGFGCSVADGNEAVKAAADYVTEAKGGQGAVREVVERILGTL